MRQILISITSVESLRVQLLKEAVLSLQLVLALFSVNGREHIPLLNLEGRAAVMTKSHEREAVTFCELSISFFLMLKITWNRSLRSITRGSACVATNDQLIDTWWCNLNHVEHNSIANLFLYNRNYWKQFDNYSDNDNELTAVGWYGLVCLPFFF